MIVGVAGGFGFLGQHVCKALTENGHHPIAFSRRTGVDMRDFDVLAPAINSLNAEVIINCAADSGGIDYGNAATLYENNLLIGHNLCRAAMVAKVSKLVNIYPNIVYPTGLSNRSESEWLNGRIDDSLLSTAMARQTMWAQCYAYHKVYNYNSIHLVLPNLYGPGDRFHNHPHALGALVVKVVDAKVNNNDKVTIWGTGAPVREWGYVEDIATGIVKAMEMYDQIYPLNIGSGIGYSITNIARLIANAAEWEGYFIYDLDKEDGPRRKVLDVSRMKSILNWEPPTGILDGIHSTVEWYINNGGADDTTN